jgi:DNA-binding response OmpR family regulator
LPAARAKVLVVDDNVDAAETLAEWLACEGHQVCVAHDGRSALDVAAQERPHAYILDIGLPGMDGMELARHLRQMPHSAQAWLVALTGYGQEADRDKSAKAGFDEHFIKPVEADDLRASLARMQRRLDGTAPSPETPVSAVCQAHPGLPGE